MTFSHMHLSKSIFLAFVTSSTLTNTSSSIAGELPPAPKSLEEINQLFKLYLELNINQYPTQKIIPIIVKNNEYFIQKSKLIKDFDIHLPDEVLFSSEGSSLTDKDVLILGFSGNSNDWLSLENISSLNYQYIPSKQIFNLSIPAEWMPTQMIGQDSWHKPEVAESGIGLLNNYDFYILRPSYGNTTSSLFTEQRFFSPHGVLTNSGVYVNTQNKGVGNNTSAKNKDGYKRYDTNWQYDFQQNATSIMLGDIFTSNKTTWGSSIRLGGFQVQRNYSTRPDLITYPLPQFEGQVALPSTVDLIINGQKASSTNVQSGPFILNNIPFINGKGEAIIVTTDAVGRKIATTVPFYISNYLLKPGLFDYSLSIGYMRKDYGLKNFSYDTFASAFDSRYGVNNWFTAEGRSELSNSLQLVGIGSVLKLGDLGVLNSSFSQSRVDKLLLKDQTNSSFGNQFSVSYSYNRNRLGFNASHINRNKEYYDLSRLQYSSLTSANSNKSTTVNTYFASKKSGTFGVGYIQTESKKIENKLLNFSWAPVLPSYMKGTTVSLNANHDFIYKKWNAAFQVSLPLFQRSSTVNTGYSFDRSGDYGYINYNHSTPLEGGFGYDLTYRFNENSENSNQARFNYRNKYLNSDFGLSGKDNYNYWFGLIGSFVFMENSFYAANRLGDSFALIDTNKVPDVQVHYENNLIGRSNKKGHIFVPSVTPYYSGKYSVNPIDLPSNYTITQVENRVAAKRGSGVVIKFPLKNSYSANVYLSLNDGQPVPVGSIVHRTHHESSYVGIDGIAYLEDLETVNLITVQLPDQSICKANFAMDKKQAKEMILTIKPVVCKGWAQ